jgi:hypothetical protein
MSYAWHNILKGIGVLKHGVIKWIGDGMTINIWQDPLLPRPWNRKPITVCGHRVMNLVSQLMDPATGN